MIFLSVFSAAIAIFSLIAFFIQRTKLKFLTLQNSSDKTQIEGFTQANNVLMIHKTRIETDLDSKNEQLLKKEEELEKIRDLLEEKRNEISAHLNTITQLKTTNESLDASLKNHAELIKKSEDKLKLLFENTAHELLSKHSSTLSKTSQEGVENILKPFKTQLDTFQKNFTDSLAGNFKEQVILKNELEKVVDFSKILDGNVTKLANALRGNFKVQGNWSEMLLEKLLETSGLKRGEHFTAQASGMDLRDEEGKRAIPDYLINFPDGKTIIIDSKASIKHAIDYFSTDSEEERKSNLESYIASVKDHVKDLSEKDYQSLNKLEMSPDFIIMFVPHDSAYLIALEYDQELIQWAFNKKIVIASPSLIIPILSMVHNIWRFHSINLNAAEISQEAGKMYDGFVSFAETLLSIGSHIDKSKEKYNEAIKRLNHSGVRSPSLVSRAEKVKGLGAKASKQLPKEIIQNHFDGGFESIEVVDPNLLVTDEASED